MNNLFICKIVLISMFFLLFPFGTAGFAQDATFYLNSMLNNPPEMEQKMEIYNKSFLRIYPKTGIHEYFVSKGKYSQEIEGDEFFKEMGRDDLAIYYNNKQRIKKPLLYGGAAIMCASLIPLGYLSSGSDSAVPMYTMLALFTGGLTTSMIGMFINPWPLENHELYEIVDKHNKKLRKKLGLSVGMQFAF